MKNTNNLCLILLFISFLSCKKEYHNEYENLPHQGGKILSIGQLSFDTIRIDASSTSMDGQWSVSNDTFYFADAYLAGVSTFDLYGNFADKHIEKGRGPNEILSPFLAITFSPDRELTGIDMSWYLYRFDTLYHRKDQLYRLYSEVKYDESDWNNLLRKPDPEINQMYEFNTSTKKLKIIGDKVLIPILSEHIHFNGYNLKDRAKDFWAESYTFQLFDIKQGKALQKIGHYPPIYFQKNIPVFSGYNFDLYKDKIYSTFMADSLIYVRNLEGKLLYSFGYSSGLNPEKLPETETFEEHEKVRNDHLARYGYYTDLLVTDDYVLRGYKKEGKGKYGIQIYKDHNLVGDIPMNTAFRFIGKNGNFYYLLLDIDLDNEYFEIVRFRIPYKTQS